MKSPLAPQSIRALMRAALLLSSLLTVSACGAGASSFDAFRAARTLTAELGELEDRAVSLTRGLTDALTAPAADPEESLSRLNAYIEENAELMHDVAAGIAARIENLPSDEEAAYLEAVSDYLSDATFAWHDACAAFSAENPSHSDTLSAAIERLSASPSRRVR